MEIDLVITWVDGEDVIHQQERQKYLWQSNGRDKTAVQNYRWWNNGELEMLLLSAGRYAPWLRYIHIVVSLAQRPVLTQLPPEILAKLKYVDDVTILPENAIPNFNSHAYEAVFHRIPNLAEHFLYACDDMFFGAPVQPSDFFDAKTGMPRMSAGNLLPPPNGGLAVFPAWYAARANNAAILRKMFGNIPNIREHKHQIRPLLRSTYEAMWNLALLRNALQSTVMTRFRHYTNIEPVGLSQQLSMRWHIPPPTATLTTEYMTWNDDTDLKAIFAGLRKRRPQLFCVNDEQQKHLPQAKTLFQEQFRAYLGNVATENQQCIAGAETPKEEAGKTRGKQSS